jgi:hypothetical protein
MPKSTHVICFVLAMMDDLSGFVELAAGFLLIAWIYLSDWSGGPSAAVWWGESRKSEQELIFYIRAIDVLREVLGTQHYSITAYSPWENGA